MRFNNFIKSTNITSYTNIITTFNGYKTNNEQRIR